MTTPLIHQIEEYVVRFFDTHPNNSLTYHTLRHTQAVVKAAKVLADQYQLSEVDYTAVVASAWFHDLGYMTTPLVEHEDSSAVMATHFLEQTGADLVLIEAVQRCILATKMPQAPNTRIEEILCDADMVPFRAGRL